MKTKIFKTIALTVLIGLGSLSSRTFAGNNPGNVRNKIQNNLSLPEELKKEGSSQKVKVSFVLNANGEIKEVIARASDPILKKSIESQFKKLKLAELQEGAYHVEIIFNVH